MPRRILVRAKKCTTCKATITPEKYCNLAGQCWKCDKAERHRRKGEKQPAPDPLVAKRKRK
jgi:hypothetical protein